MQLMDTLSNDSSNSNLKAIIHKWMEKEDEGQREDAEVQQRILETSPEMLPLVVTLEPFLNHPTDPFTRSKAVQLLSDVCIKKSAVRSADQCVTGHQSLQTEASFLLDFFLSRLHDQQSVEPCLQGILALAKWASVNSFDKTAGASKCDWINVPTGIFRELTLQSFQPQVRHVVYSILHILLSTNLLTWPSNDFTYASPLSPSEFLISFLACFEGEKDPKNLHIAFHTLSALIQHPIMPIQKHVQILFDAVICYFPITFRALPPKSVGMPSAEDLKLALREVLAATPLFGPLAVPVFMDKVTSSSGNAKRDAFQTLAACSAVYSPVHIKRYSSQLWKLIKDEMMKDSGESEVEAAMECLVALTAQQARTTSVTETRPSPEQGLIEVALSDIIPVISKGTSDESLVPSVKILAAMASTSASVAARIFRAAVPLLVAKVTTDTPPSQQAMICNCICDFLLACRIYQTQVKEAMSVSMRVDGEEDLSDVWMSVFQLFSGHLCSLPLMKNPPAPDESSLYVICVKGLGELLCAGHIVESDLIPTLNLLSNILPISDNCYFAFPDELCIEATRVLVAFAQIDPTRVMDYVLDAALVRLSTEEDVSRQKYLDLLSKFAGIDAAFEFIVSSLAARSSTNTLACFYPVLIARADVESHASSDYPQRLLDKYVEVIHNAALSFIASAGDGDAELLFRLYSRVLVCLSETSQANLIRAFAQNQNDVNMSFTSFARVVVLSACICFCARPLIAGVSGCGDPVDFATRIIEYCLNPSDERTVPYLSKAAGSLLNKISSSHSGKMEQLVRILGDRLLQPTGCISTIHVISLKCWVTKGLILAGEPFGLDLLDALLSDLSLPSTSASKDEGEELSIFTASCLGTLIEEDGNGVLTKRSFNVIKPLFKQKVFKRALPLILLQYKKGSSREDSSTTTACLIALSHLLRHVPKALLVGDIQALLPMLLQALTLPNMDGPMRVASIDTVCLLMTEMPDRVNRDAGSLVSAFLALTMRHVDPSLSPEMSVRIAALKALTKLGATMPYTSIHPLRGKVIARLGGVLADPKRLVRQEAVRTRNAWYLLGGSDA